TQCKMYLQENNSFYLAAIRRPIRRPLVAKGPNSLFKIGRAKQFPARMLSHLPGLFPVEPASLRDETEAPTHGVGARASDRGRDLAGSRFQLRGGCNVMRQTHCRSLPGFDNPAGDGQRDRTALPDGS